MKADEIHTLAKAEGVDTSAIEHEIREVRFLEAIAKDPVLALHLAFKGGTALRLVYGLDRYSDDLDFDRVRPDASPEELFARLRSLVEQQGLEETDAKIKRNTLLLNTREKRGQRNLKIEVSLQKHPPQGAIIKNIVTRVYPASVNVLTYPLPVLLSGKILAVLKRPDATPRDLYDLFWFLSRDVQEDWQYLQLHGYDASADRRLLYQSLLEQVGNYAEKRIASELCAMLPRERREWVRGNLKQRTKELLELRIWELS